MTPITPEIEQQQAIAMGGLVAAVAVAPAAAYVGGTIAAVAADTAAGSFVGAVTVNAPQIVASAAIVAEVGAGAAGVAQPGSAPNFVVSPKGMAFPVPKGAQGPTPVINPAGKQTGVQFTGGAGGTNGQVATMRVMDPNRLNPSGYVKYENSSSPKPQGVDPYTGRTLPPEKAHHEIDR